MTADGASASSPARVGGLDRVTGRQAYVADIHLDDVLHVKLVGARLRPGADRSRSTRAPPSPSPASGS